MKEVISVHIGQAGAQIGDSAWELYCLEHGIHPSGYLAPETGKTFDNDINLNSAFFTETEKSKFVPRTVYLDLEPTVLDEIRKGQYRKLYHPRCLVNGKEDAANNFARGRYTVGADMLEGAMNAIRLEAEQCDNLQGFLLYHSFGGGTGSGLTTQILEKLDSSFYKKSRFNVAIYPSPRVSTSIVEPYNAVLMTHAVMDWAGLGYLIDNEAIYRICTRQMHISRPSYTNLNRFISQVVSSITAPMRFRNTVDCNMNEMELNIVPTPRIHFPLLSYAPIWSENTASCERVNVQQLMNMCFDPLYQLVNCNSHDGDYLSCIAMFRGNTPKAAITRAIAQTKERLDISFIDWCPTGFKVGISDKEPVSIPGSKMPDMDKALCLQSNNTGILTAWQRLVYKYDQMFNKRAFVHWYLSEGMEESEFYDSRDDMAKLSEDYHTVVEKIKQDHDDGEGDGAEEDGENY